MSQIAMGRWQVTKVGPDDSAEVHQLFAVDDIYETNVLGEPEDKRFRLKFNGKPGGIELDGSWEIDPDDTDKRILSCMVSLKDPQGQPHDHKITMRCERKPGRKAHMEGEIEHLDKPEAGHFTGYWHADEP